MTEEEVYALYSKRLKLTISGCTVNTKAKQEYRFPIVGKYFPRLPVPGKVSPEDRLEVYRLDQPKPKLIAVILFDTVTPESIPEVQESDSSEQDLVVSAEKAAPEGEAQDTVPNEEESSEEEISEGMPPEEMARLQKQCELAVADEDISSDDGGQDSKDEEMAAKGSNSSSDDDSDDEYVRDPRKAFERAPDQFVVTVGQKIDFKLTFKKNHEEKAFQLIHVQFTVVKKKDSDEEKWVLDKLFTIISKCLFEQHWGLIHSKK